MVRLVFLFVALGLTLPPPQQHDRHQPAAEKPTVLMTGLGRLGGVFRGTIVQCRAGEGFFVADAFWLPPDGEAIGPMALEVKLQTESSGGTRVQVTQTGFEESARWRRYYEVVELGWTRALASLKALLETPGLGTGS